LATSSADPKEFKIKRFRNTSEAERRRAQRPLAALDFAEDIIMFLVATVLVCVAAYVLYQSIADFFTQHEAFASRITDVTNGILFVIIILEILTTVVAHFEVGGFQLKPFLIIGIISAVRHILSVGAQESLTVSTESTSAFRQAQIGLGVNAAVVLALAIGLILVRRTDAYDNTEEDVE
jgi:uncharacterized membrane protein (DUF373 family)